MSEEPTFEPSGVDTEAPISVAEQGPEPPPVRPRRFSFWLLAIPVLLAGVGMWGYHYYQCASSHASTDDAHITADITQISHRSAAPSSRSW